MANIWEKYIFILAENLNSGRTYLITAVKKSAGVGNNDLIWIKFSIIKFLFSGPLSKYPQSKITKKTSNPCVKTEKESKRNRRGCDPSE